MMKRKSPDGSSQSISETTNHGSIDQSVHHHHAPTFYQKVSDPTQSMESDDLAIVEYNIPKKNESFVNRPICFKKIKKAFKSRSVIHVLHGFGGMGKTQLANHFLLNMNGNYQLIAKLRAESDVVLQEDLIELGKKLKLEIPRGKPRKEKAHQVVSHLSNNFKGKLLLFYDNAQSHDQINSYIPTCFNQHVLVTSRDCTNWASCTTQQILSMTEGEAITLLGKLIAKQFQDSELEQAKQLVNTLGCLPLAIAQAGVYIRNYSTGINDYLELYESKKRELLKQKLPEGLEHEEVYITFDININYLRKHSLDALTLVDICSYCYADQVPEWFLQAIVPIDQMAYNACKQSINQCSLLDFNTDTQSTSVHRILQTVRRLQNTYASDFEVLKKLIAWINNKDNYFYNYEHAEFNRNAKFLIHASSIVDYIIKEHIAVEIPPFVFYTIGLFYLDYEYDSIKAESYLKAALDRIDKADDNKLKAKICRQYAKVLSRLDPENIQQIRTYFDRACEYDPTLIQLTTVDKLVQRYNEIKADCSTMIVKVENLENLVIQCDSLIADNQYDSLNCYLQYTKLKIILSLLFFLEKLIEYKNENLSKQKLWQTQNKTKIQFEIRELEVKQDKFYNSQLLLQKSLAEQVQIIPVKTAVMISYQLARAAKQSKQYKIALQYIKEAWGLKSQSGNDNEKFRILMFYADMLVRNNQKDETKELLKSEKDNFDGDNQKKLTDKLKEISNQSILSWTTSKASSMFGSSDPRGKKCPRSEDSITSQEVDVERSLAEAAEKVEQQLSKRRKHSGVSH